MTLSWWVIIALWIPGLVVLLYVLLKIRQEKRKYDREQDPDPDAVMAQRKLYADGEFRRHWTRRVPHGVDVDRLDLECGHWRYYGADRPLTPDELVECSDCAKDYLRNAGKLKTKC